QRFVCLSGEERLLRDMDPAAVPDEGRKSGRKGAA
ncbi:MAG: sulfurtransferase FdhD, partial [Pseudomonadota bacterium]